MARLIEIEGRGIGGVEPCYVIAEACDNHFGDLDVAKEMALQAKLCGADAVKYQHHIPDEEMVPGEMPMSSNFLEPLYDFLQKYALKLEDHAALMNYCREIGITYLCTPFSRKAAEELEELGVVAYKIGSGELTDLPTLEAIAKFGKPMIVSTGMAELGELDTVVEFLKGKTDQLLLMHCVSEYPAHYEDLNLGLIDTLSTRYGLVVGYSDHTPDIYSSIAAVARSAKLIEKHFILDKRLPGPDQAVSIEPYEFAELVRAIHRIEKGLGSEKELHENERQIRNWAHRSVVSVVSIPRGTRIEASMVWTKRPGTGIPAAQYWEVVDSVAKVDIPANHLIKWEELEKQ